MAIKMVREPSETPNINNIDDIVPMRYAYGNQNGYVVGKGTEISNTVNGLNFIVNSGRLVLQGVECDIDASGATITIDNIATKRYYTVYLEVNLGLNTATIKSEYDTATYPSIDTGDDLTENTTGIARLPLYRFIATSGVISNVNKVVASVKYVNESFIKNVKVNNAKHADNATTSSNSNKINNLEITKDENGVLKIGDVIIPQKKLLWSGDVTAGAIVLSEDLKVGDILEIEYSIDMSFMTEENRSLEYVSKYKLFQENQYILAGVGFASLLLVGSTNDYPVAPYVEYRISDKKFTLFSSFQNTPTDYTMMGVPTYRSADDIATYKGITGIKVTTHLKKIYKIIE